MNNTNHDDEEPTSSLVNQSTPLIESVYKTPTSNVVVASNV